MVQDVADQGAFAGNTEDSPLALRAARAHALPRAGGFWLAPQPARSAPRSLFAASAGEQAEAYTAARH